MAEAVGVAGAGVVVGMINLPVVAGAGLDWETRPADRDGHATAGREVW